MGILQSMVSVQAKWEMFAPLKDLLSVVPTRVTRELTPSERQKFLHESPNK
jgi:hypothetical protein